MPRIPGSSGQGTPLCPPGPLWTHRAKVNLCLAVQIASKSNLTGSKEQTQTCFCENVFSNSTLHSHWPSAHLHSGVLGRLLEANFSPITKSKTTPRRQELGTGRGRGRPLWQRVPALSLEVLRAGLMLALHSWPHPSPCPGALPVPPALRLQHQAPPKRVQNPHRAGQGHSPRALGPAIPGCISHCRSRVLGDHSQDSLLHCAGP